MGKIIQIDFDGVLHMYNSGWKGADVIPDLPVDGAIDFIRSLVEDPRFVACIYSSRSKDPNAIEAMKKWLLDHGLEEYILEKVRFPTEKQPAFLTIDDRGFHFQGTFPDLEWIDNFKPWNKQ